MMLIRSNKKEWPACLRYFRSKYTQAMLKDLNLRVVARDPETYTVVVDEIPLDTEGEFDEWLARFYEALN